MTVSKSLNFYHVIYFCFATKKQVFGIIFIVLLRLSVEYGAEIANHNVKSIFHGKLEKKNHLYLISVDQISFCSFTLFESIKSFSVKF